MEFWHNQSRSNIRIAIVPSQQRFVRYWLRLLCKDDPRPFITPSTIESVSLPPRRRVRITSVRIRMPHKMDLPGAIGTKRITAVVSVYKPSFIADLEQRELELRRRRVLKEDGGVTDDTWDDNSWDDQHDQIVQVGRLLQVRKMSCFIVLVTSV